MKTCVFRLSGLVKFGHKGYKTALDTNHISSLSTYTTLVRHQDGQTKPMKLFLAILKDGRTVGFNPEKFKYDIFSSPKDFSDQTKIFHKYFKISIFKEDMSNFLKQILK